MHSTVGVVTALRTRQPRNRDSIPGMHEKFVSACLRPFQPCLRCAPGHFPEVRRPEPEAIHSPPSLNDVNVKWHHSFTLPHDCKVCIGPSWLLHFLNRGTLLRSRINCSSNLDLKVYRLKYAINYSFVCNIFPVSAHAHVIIYKSHRAET